MEKIIIEDITELAKDALLHPKTYKAFMGVSIRNRFFSKSNMRSYFHFFKDNFKETVILLMDDPDMYNLQVFKGLEQPEAFAKAREISDNVKTAFEKIITDLRIHTIKIIQFRDFSDTPEYKRIRSLVFDYMDKNEEFRNDLIRLIEVNIGHKIKKYLSENGIKESNNIIKILEGYIKEEIVSLIYFTELGYKIEIDPTPEFSTKRLIYEGGFLDLEKQIGISQRGHIFMYPQDQSYLPVKGNK